MTGVEYLYSYGRRRHIRRPDGQKGRYGDTAEAWCGDWFDTDASYFIILDRWNRATARQAMERKRAESICQRCQRAHDKAEATRS